MRRDAAALPEGSDKTALLEVIAQQEESFGPIAKILEKESMRLRKQRFGRFGFLLPLAIAMSYFPVRGLLEGKVRNLLGALDGNRHRSFSAEQYPYTYWDTDPYLFGFFVLFYSLIAFALFAATFDVMYFGRRRQRTRAEFDRELAQLQRDPPYPESQWVRRRVFGQEMHYQRVSPVVAAIVIAGGLGLIAYKVLQIYLG